MQRVNPHSIRWSRNRRNFPNIYTVMLSPFSVGKTQEVTAKVAPKWRNFLNLRGPGGNWNEIWLTWEKFLLYGEMRGIGHISWHRKRLRNDRGDFGLAWKTDTLCDLVRDRAQRLSLKLKEGNCHRGGPSPTTWSVWNPWSGHPWWERTVALGTANNFNKWTDGILEWLKSPSNELKEFP